MKGQVATSVALSIDKVTKFPIISRPRHNSSSGLFMASQDGLRDDTLQSSEWRCCYPVSLAWPAFQFKTALWGSNVRFLPQTILSSNYSFVRLD